MERPKPPRVPKEYEEGPEAACQLDALTRRVIIVPREEIKTRQEKWERNRKSHQKKVRR